MTITTLGLTTHGWTLLQHAAEHRHGRGPTHQSWFEALFDDWSGPQTATLLAALIAIIGVVATILTTSARAQREHRANLYADALGGVADYLEGPYRIRRKDGTSAHRNAITAALSDVKSSIDHSQELLRLHARPEVANFLDDYVLAAKFEAGPQMHEAWMLPAITTDEQVNLHTGYERTESQRYRSQVVGLMQADLSRRWWRPWVAVRYAGLARKQLPHPTPPDKPAPTSEPAGGDKSMTRDS